MLMTGDPRLYMQVHADLLSDIKTGALRPGKPAPSIESLCVRYAAGRQTVAKALWMLEDDAWLIYWPGLGYYVAPEVAGEMGPVTSRTGTR